MQFERSMIWAVDDSKIVNITRTRLGKSRSAQCLHLDFCEFVLVDGPGIEQDPGIGETRYGRVYDGESGIKTSHRFRKGEPERPETLGNESKV
jgi:hypothetical protein